MKNIGKYQGIACYECTDKEYKDALNSGQDNGRQIFIIGETMVKKNEIIGYYNGSFVRDVYDGVPYVVQRQPGPQMPMDTEPAESAEVEEVLKEIRFSDYSKVVDEFFALLEA